MNIKEQISEVQEKVNDLKYKLAVEEAVLARLKSLGGKKRRVSHRGTKEPRQGSLAACLQSVLQQSSGALAVNQLVERVKQGGFVTTANVGLNNLIPSAMVRRKDIFVRVSHGVYDLKARAEQKSQG